MKLRQSQKDALSKFREHYFKNEEANGNLVACCGYGKTFLSYNIFKECMKKKDNLFVLVVPSTQLITQTLENYVKYNNDDDEIFDIRYISSLDGKAYKPYKIYNSDIDNFISTRSRPLIIIITYDSSKKIINVLKENLADLIIFDEAHKTTGEGGKKYQKLIDTGDECIKRKSLYMTATPVKYIRNENKKYSRDDTYTMENDLLYGEEFYRYNFSEAINDKILTDFRCIYLIKKNTEKYKELCDKVKDMSPKNRKNVYNRILCQMTINGSTKFKLKKILVYTKNKTEMKRLEDEFNRYLDQTNQTDKFNVSSITCKYTANQRKKILEEFGDCSTNKVNILLNVRLFDEGIDIPCIDTIVFTSTRESETVIIQNIGRCLRKYKHKKMSYVIIPNYIYNHSNELNSVEKYSSKFVTIRKMINDIRKSGRNLCIRGKLNEIEISKDNERQRRDKNKDTQKINTRNDIVDCEYDVFNLHEAINISNKTYEEHKKEMNEAKLKNISEYSDYVLSKNLIKLDPVLLYEAEWVSWSNFLFDEIPDYNECKAIISKISKLHNITSVNDWRDFYNDYFKYKFRYIFSNCTLCNGMFDKENAEQKHKEISLSKCTVCHKLGVCEICVKSDEIQNDMIKLPRRPRKYFGELYTREDYYTGFEKNKESGGNRINNDRCSDIGNIINNDEKKINAWEHYYFDSNDKSAIEVINYLSTLIGKKIKIKASVNNLNRSQVLLYIDYFDKKYDGTKSLAFILCNTSEGGFIGDKSKTICLPLKFRNFLKETCRRFKKNI